MKLKVNRSKPGGGGESKPPPPTPPKQDSDPKPKKPLKGVDMSDARKKAAAYRKRLKAAQDAARKRALAVSLPLHPDAREEPLEIDPGTDGAAELAAGMAAVGIDTRRNVRTGGLELQLPEWAGRGDDWRGGDGGRSLSIAARLAAGSCVVAEDPDSENGPRRLSVKAETAGAAKLLLSAVSPEIDPFLERIQSIAWDKKQRIDGCLEHVFNVADGIAGPGTDLLAAASRLAWMGAVKRALEPGALVRETLVLQGENERDGKSAFVRRMVFDVNEWICEDFPFRGTKNRQWETLKGRVVAELAEMPGVGSGGAADKQVKAALTMRVLAGVRDPWAPEPEDHPARHVFVGTVNHRECLPAEDQNTRFVVVSVDGAKAAVEDLMDDDYVGQCWAEALARVQRGDPHDVPRYLLDEQTAANTDYLAVGTAWVERVRTVLKANADAALERAEGGFKMRQAGDGYEHTEDWAAAGVHVSQIVEAVRGTFIACGSGNIDNEIGPALRSNGWKSKRERPQGRNGPQVTLWRPGPGNPGTL